tara:strand:- start:1744 stop:2040 length:297 start_codon:yes stop_codon:yes gene_type:complete
MILAGALSAAGLLFLLFKFGIRRVINFDIPIDIGMTTLLMMLFAGTFGGMMAAMVGGLIISVTLYAMKATMVREKYIFVKSDTFPYRKGMWVKVNPNE